VIGVELLYTALSTNK